MKAWKLIGILAVVLLVALYGCKKADVEPEPTGPVEPVEPVEPEPVEPEPMVPEGATITLDGLTLEDGDVSVEAGATITWVNEGDVDHIVLINDANKAPIAKSTTLGNGDEFSYTFETAGEFPWASAGFPGLVKGVVTVE
ncbi:hypothetical protein KY330_02430 [Candidatus Woesearchaeota archaeon]|nr:hypothetical protein [Candidatus Woesearchaeota archaeon]